MTSPSNRRAATSTTSAAADTEAAEPALDLKFTNIAGGALAAVTTAVAVSFLGVTGTLTGAAVGSVLSSVAAAVYAASFKTAGSRIRATRTLVPRSDARTGGDPQDPATVPADLTGRSVPLPGETTVFLPAQGGGEPPTGAVPPVPAAGAPHRPAGRRLPWKGISVLAGVVFLVAMAAIFMTEVVIGHPISDSKQTGTTVSRVVQGGGAPATDPSDDEKSPSPTDSQSPSPSGSSPTDSPSPTDSTDSTTDSGSLAPGETTSSTDSGATDGGRGDTSTSDAPSSDAGGQDGQGAATSEPAAPADSPAQDGGAAAVTPTP